MVIHKFPEKFLKSFLENLGFSIKTQIEIQNNITNTYCRELGNVARETWICRQYRTNTIRGKKNHYTRSQNTLHAECIKKGRDWAASFGNATPSTNVCKKLWKVNIETSVVKSNPAPALRPAAWLPRFVHLYYTQTIRGQALIAHLENPLLERPFPSKLSLTLPTKPITIPHSSALLQLWTPEPGFSVLQLATIRELHADTHWLLTWGISCYGEPHSLQYCHWNSIHKQLLIHSYSIHAQSLRLQQS